MSHVNEGDKELKDIKKELDPISDVQSSKMSIWAKASSVLNPLKSKTEHKEEISEIDTIVEIKESKLGLSSKGTDDDKSFGGSQVTVKSSKNSKLNQ
jgi:archaellum component FlaC